MLYYFIILKDISNDREYTPNIENNVYLDTISSLHKFLNGIKTNYLGLPNHKFELKSLLNKKSLIQLAKEYSLEELLLNHIILVNINFFEIYELSEKNITLKIKLDGYSPMDVIDFGKVCIFYGFENYLVINEK